MTRNVVITGGNSGIGYEMALALAGRGDRVLIAARDMDKSKSAVAAIQARQPSAKVEALPLDLADDKSVDGCAAEIIKRMPVVDVLILNAGVFTRSPRKLANGLEAMIGIMHFGHFRLTDHLLDAVKAAPQGRIVVTSSVGHKLGRIDEASFTDPSRIRPALKGYGQAKLANLLFTRELARRLKGTKVTVNAFHPGAVATGIYRELPWPLPALIRLVLLTPAQGADTGIWLATAPELENVTGEYFVKRRKRYGSAPSRDAALAARLWAISEERLRAA